ncbi:MAG: mechanosensitive ion channel family protein [Bryobacteraceae bacterium]
MIAGFWEKVQASLAIPVFKLGSAQVTLWSLLYVLVLLLLLFYFTGRITRLLVARPLQRSKLDASARQAVTSIFQYAVLVIGLLIIMQTAGIDVTTLNVLAGTFGIGVGFGLQNIASNFISGLIILFERPVKLGDRIEVGSVEGDVVQIRPRSTTVLTNDNIAIIIPNSRFITENVVNWSYNDTKVRFRIPVSVAYGSDVRLVERCLLEVAAECPDVLRDPAPVVRFLEFGESALHMELRAWSTTLMQRKGKLISTLNFAIYDKFDEHGIHIPYPQRDLHIRGGGVEVKLVDSTAPGARE